MHIEKSGPDTAALTDAFLSAKSPRTIAAYCQDLDDFRQSVNAATVDDDARILLGNSPGAANILPSTIAPG